MDQRFKLFSNISFQVRLLMRLLTRWEKCLSLFPKDRKVWTNMLIFSKISDWWRLVAQKHAFLRKIKKRWKNNHPRKIWRASLGVTRPRSSRRSTCSFTFTILNVNTLSKRKIPAFWTSRFVKTWNNTNIKVIIANPPMKCSARKRMMTSIFCSLKRR